MVTNFKNYKEMCEYLNEPIKTGKSKQLQLNKWREKFDFHFEGHRIVIDAEREKGSNVSHKRGGNNHKNQDIYIPYIYNCIYEHFPDNESMTRILCDTLSLFNEDTLKIMYNDPEKLEQSFLRWLKRAGKFASETVVKALDTLQRDGLITYSTAYAFLSNPKRMKYVVYARGFDDYIKKTEVEVCNQLNKKHHLSTQISGKQLEFLINKNKRLSNEYLTAKLSRFTKDSEFMSVLKGSANEIYYGIDFGSDNYPIKKYWKVWSVTEIEPPDPVNMQEARQKYIDLIIKKTTKGKGIPDEWYKLAFYVDSFKGNDYT